VTPMLPASPKHTPGSRPAGCASGRPSGALVCCFVSEILSPFCQEENRYVVLGKTSRSQLVCYRDCLGLTFRYSEYCSCHVVTYFLYLYDSIAGSAVIGLCGPISDVYCELSGEGSIESCAIASSSSMS